MGRGGVSAPAQRRRSAARTRLAHSERWRRVGGVLLLALAIFSAVGLAPGIGGRAADWNGVLVSAFGWGSYLTPLLFSIFALALIWSTIKTSYRFQRREAVGWLILFAFFATIFQLLANDLRPSTVSSGGGFLGQMITQLLFLITGPSHAITYGITIGFGLLGLVLASSLGPAELWAGLVLAIVAAVWLTRRLLRFSRRLLALSMKSWREFRQRQAARQQQPHFRINRPERDNVAPSVPSPPPVLPTPAPIPPRGSGADQPSRSRPAETARADPTRKPPLPASTITSSTVGGVPRSWQLPPLALLEVGAEGELSEADINQKVQRIEETLLDFGIRAHVVEVNPGPVVTQFGLDPGFRERRDRNGNVVRRDKVKVSEITALRDDLALALAARTVRIEAPVPGRAVIGLEIPNSTASVVQLRRVIETTAFQRVRLKSKLAVALGQEVSGGTVAADLAKMPHLLIAGATGSGKSVCMNAIITCFLLHATPDEVRMVMIDPKRVELTSFREVPHLLRSVVVDVEHAVSALKWVIREMELRLRRFEAQGVRNIEGYNRLMGSRDGKEAMPYIVLLIDELADLMMSAPDEVEHSICRLAQLARATGIHLVIATQRPSVDVVTGLIKANFPTRISFAVASQVDSRTILDSVGAEQLLGSGDMLYMPADASKPRRLQGVYLADDEVQRVVEFWKNQGAPHYVQDLEDATWQAQEDEKADPFYEKAVDVARQHTRISASLLQRRLGVGYNRAARLVDLLEEHGVVGGAEGGKPREVLMPPPEDGDALVAGHDPERQDSAYGQNLGR